MTPFEHLHVRSVYASLYGMVRLDELAEAQRCGVACATDPTLRSAARLVKACKGKAQPVHGLELAPRDAGGHLVLLALDEEGWRLLKDLSARAAARVDGGGGKAKTGAASEQAAPARQKPAGRGKSAKKAGTKVVKGGAGAKKAGTKAAKEVARAGSDGIAEATKGSVPADPWVLGVTLADVAAARGVAVLTGGAEGALAAAWRAGGSVAADELLAGLRGAEVWVELAPTMGPLWRELWAWAASRGLPVVATGDVAYLSRRQAPAWHVLRAVAGKRRADRRLLARCAEVARGGSQEAQGDPSAVGGVAGQGGGGQDARTGPPERAVGMPGERPSGVAEVSSEHGVGWRWGHLASREEMEEFFRDCPAAVRNAAALAARCWSGIKLGLVALPDYVSTDGRPLGPAEQVAELRRLARAGLAARVGQREEYEKRLGYELDVIVGTGFAGYFLIYADFMRWAREKGIAVGPGRGSAAGSLAVWCLGITELDPIEHGLLFERFMNPERCGKVGPDGRPQAGSGGGLPDIDTDICKRRRWEVIEYLREKYGRGSVGRIVTYKVLVGKTALKDAGRAFGLGFHRLNALLAGAPVNVKNKKGELKAPTVDWLAENCAALRDAAATDTLVAEVVAAARELEECVRDAGVHPSGVVIGRGPLADWVPCASTKDGELCSQWDMREAEDAGLVKLDLLGLSTVTMLDLAKKMSGVELASLPLDDQATYGLMARGDTLGVFQMGKGGFRRMLREMRPDRFGDVVAAGALYRPGPIQTGMVRGYCARKHKREQVSYWHPSLEAVSAETYGIVCYQETVLWIARLLAGYSLGEADILRRAVGKKKPEEMRKQRERFISGCARLGTCDEKRAVEIFDSIEKWADYGFNRSVDGNTTIPIPGGRKRICDVRAGDVVYGIDEGGNRVPVDVVDIHDHGVMEGVEVQFDDGYTVVCSLEHKFLTTHGQIPIREIVSLGLEVLADEDLHDEMWSPDRRTNPLARSSKNVPTVHLIAEVRGQEEIHLAVQEGISAFRRHGRASEDLCHMPSREEDQHPQADAGVGEIQRYAGTEEDFLRHGSTNIGQGGHPSTEGREVAAVEREESREVQRDYRQRDVRFWEEKQERKRPTRDRGLSARPGALRSREEASGLRVGEGVDRSGRLLPLLYAGQEVGRKSTSSASVGERARTRRDAQPRGFAPRHMSDSPIRGVFPLFDRQVTIDVGAVAAEHAPISDAGRLVRRRVVRVRPVGRRRMYDIEVASATHNFLLPNGVVTSNSHATAYGLLSYYTAWLKANRPVEFYAAWLSILADEADAPKKLGEAAYDMREHGVELLPPCVHRSVRDFAPEGGKVRYGLSALRGLARDCAARLERGRPFRNMADLLRRAAPNKRDLFALAGSGALDELLRAEGVSRARALASLDALAKWSQQERKRFEKDERTGQRSFDLG